MSMDSSYASPLADAQLPVPELDRFDGIASKVLGGLNGWTVALSIFLMLVVYDQWSYIRQKGPIAGPSWKIPFMGPFLESVNPKFEKYYATWTSAPISCVSVFHKFVVLGSTRDIARKILNSPTYLKPCVVDVASKILRPNNWVFLDGREHVDYRKGLNGLFTRQALESYLPGQEDVYDKYFERLVQITKDNGGEPVPFMHMFREMITAVSLRTFVGHYLEDAMVKKIADEYYHITEALELVNFPIILPYTRAWYGKKAADMVIEELSKCAAKAKVRIAAGGETSCIMDNWVKGMYESEAWRQKTEKGEDAGEKPAQLIRMFSDLEISMTILTFLFASQDATSSACTWLFQVMAQRPEILDRVREENLKARNGDRNARFSMDLLESLTYTRAVVKELLRYRPPVIMIPYMAKKDFPITPEYTCPKGSMVIPVTWLALRDPEAYPNPDTYDPERWITGNAEAQGKNWLVFGTGPHYCIGQTYAQLNLIAMIGKAAMHLDWVHHPTPRSEEIKVFATIFPMDNCPLTYTKRD
ncbi:MAG: RNA polymerase C-22 sterol desaturase [Bogoriella megaspora]|nr:MAG: RNA polymerase C-22 sterol desaturase [Bogoriella megaspora]